MSQIIAIGNPGSGKSSILNAFAGQLLFQSGVSVGSGLTTQLESRESNGKTYIDTPGLADYVNRKAAGEALSKVFLQGGRMKILFILTQQSGRIVLQDIATMKLILESVPEIGRNYGVFVNKVPEQVMDQLKNLENIQKFVLGMFLGIKDEFRHNYVLILPTKSKMECNDNVLMATWEIHPSLEKFLKFMVPECDITPGKVRNINVDEIEQLTRHIEEVEAELRQNSEQHALEKERLIAQLKDTENRRKQEEEDLQIAYQQKIAMLNEKIEEAEEKKNSTIKDAEKEDFNLQIEKTKLMQSQQMLVQQQQILVELRSSINRCSPASPFMLILQGIADIGKTIIAAKSGVKFI